MGSLDRRKRTVLLASSLSLGLALAPAAGSGAASLDWNDAQIEWLGHTEGLRRIAETGRPGLLIFFTEWCPQCKTYSRLFRDPELVRLSRRFVMIRVDRDREAALNRRYAQGGTYVPRTLFLQKDRKVDWSTRGSQPEYPHFLDTGSPAELKRLMQRFLAGQG